MPTQHSAVSRFGMVFLDGIRLLVADLPPSLFEGAASSAWASVWFGMEEPHHSVVNGCPLPDTSVVVGPPGARCQAFWPQQAAPAQLAVAISVPAARVPRSWPVDSAWFTVHRVDADVLRRLRCLVRAILRRAAEHPETLEDQVTAAALASALIDGANALFVGARDVVFPSVVFTRRYFDVLDQIDRFIADRMDRPVRLEEVAEALRLAPRTVHNIMTMMRGLTLQAYVKAIKMRSARRHLLRNETCDLVKQAALALGYTHLGRFAQEYTKFFGEPPSATLARRSR